MYVEMGEGEACCQGGPREEGPEDMEALDGLTLYEHKEQRRLLVGRDLLRISIKH